MPRRIAAIETTLVVHIRSVNIHVPSESGSRKLNGFDSTPEAVSLQKLVSAMFKVFSVLPDSSTVAIFERVNSACVRTVTVQTITR